MAQYVIPHHTYIIAAEKQKEVQAKVAALQQEHLTRMQRVQSACVEESQKFQSSVLRFISLSVLLRSLLFAFAPNTRTRTYIHAAYAHTHNCRHILMHSVTADSSSCSSSSPRRAWPCRRSWRRILPLCRLVVSYLCMHSAHDKFCAVHILACGVMC